MVRNGARLRGKNLQATSLVSKENTCLGATKRGLSAAAKSLVDLLFALSPDRVGISHFSQRQDLIDGEVVDR